MNLILTFLIIILFYCEIRFVRRRRADLAARGFQLPGWVLGLYVTLMVAVLASGRRPGDLAGIFFLFVFPVFLYRHTRLRAVFRHLRARRASAGYAGEDRGEGARDPDTNMALGLDGFGVIYVWLIGLLIFQVLLRALSAGRGQSGELLDMVVLAAGSLGLMMALIVRVVRSYEGLTLTEVLGLSGRDVPFGKLVALPLITGAGMAVISSAILFFRESQPATPLGEVIAATDSQTVLLMFLAMAVLAAPFLEEIIFRGFFFYLIRRLRGTRAAVAVIAVVFAGMHVHQYWTDWAAIIMVGLLGLGLTLFRGWTGSVIPGMVMHYTYNGLMTVLPVIFLMTVNPSYYTYQQKFTELDSMTKEGLLLNSIDRQPQFVAAYNDLAWLYAEEGRNLDDALRLIDHALSVQPSSYAFLDTKAEVLYRMGRTREAAAMMSDLIRRYPDDTYLREQMEKFEREENAGSQKGKEAALN